MQAEGNALGRGWQEFRDWPQKIGSRAKTLDRFVIHGVMVSF